MRSPVNRFASLSALMLMAPAVSIAADKPAQPVPATGPAADYPVVVGDPFTIGDTVWTPTDQLNYDAVGYATTGAADLFGITAAHKTLPLPCYVEVTSLDTGKTILVRVTRRGPMTNNDLLELSPMASGQLGIAPGASAAVRVRRVNPPEQERAILRSGARAPERMETPDGLLRVLRRKLAEQSPLTPPPSTPPVMPKGPTTTPTAPDAKATAKAMEVKARENVKPQTPPPVAKVPAAAPLVTPPKPGAKPAAAPSTAAPAPATKRPDEAAGSLVVQVATFSLEAGASKVAKELGASTAKAGKYWRVRMGPYANRAQASAALEKAKKAGYSDARIQSAD